MQKQRATIRTNSFLALQDYRRRRESFYTRFAALCPGTILDPYDLLDPYPLTRPEITAITQAATAIAHVYKRTAILLRTVSDEALLDMGLPKLTLNFARLQIKGMPDAVISRLDLVKTAEGYKMLELNADVPGLLVEAFTINAKVCKELRKIDPNRDGELTLATSLKSAISAGLEYVGKASGEQAYIVFTSRKEYARDNDIAQYLMDLLDLPEHVQKQYIPIESLWIDENGLYGPDNKQVDLLYRIYPIQFFHRNVFRNKLDANAEIHHQQVLFHLVQSHKLTLINPSSAFLIESKAVQAVIWALYEAEKYFNIEERIFIERYFLPTYMDPFFKDEQYVIKPVYGREGDTVTIVNPKLGKVSKSTHMTYVHQPMVYQKYVEMPLIEIMTEEGLQSLHVLTSCFLTGEQPIGICLRAGHTITDYSWWFVPGCVAD